MIDKKERPEMLEQIRDVNINVGDDKYTKLSHREQKVYDILKQGKKSVTQITIALGYSDPRGYVRSLRNKGVSVFDEWIRNKDVRFKVYWIED